MCTVDSIRGADVSNSTSNSRKVSNVVVLRVKQQESTFTWVLMHKWLIQCLELQQTVNMEIQANLAEITHQTLRGLNQRINPYKSLRIFQEAMKALCSKAWAATYNQEYIGFKEQGIFKVVQQQPGIKILDTLTRLEYNEDNCEFIKCKASLAQEGTSKSME